MLSVRRNQNWPRRGGCCGHFTGPLPAQQHRGSARTRVGHGDQVPEGQACSWRGLLPGSDPMAATRAGGPCPPFCSGASGQWALREVWLASRAGLRPPAVGLRCSRTVVPGAEVFSISVLSPTRLNLKPRVHPSAPLSPFPLLCSAAFLRRVHLQGRKWQDWVPGPQGHLLLSLSLAAAPPLLPAVGPAFSQKHPVLAVGSVPT